MMSIGEAGGRPKPNAKIEIVLSAIPNGEGFTSESLWALALPNDEYEIYSIPAFAYNLNLGDVVSCTAIAGGLPRVHEVVRRSGRQTLRVSFGPSPDLDLVSRILSTLRSRGSLVEPFGSGSFGVSTPSFEELGWACRFICEVDPDEKVVYESGFSPAEPYFDASLPVAEGSA